MDEAIWDKSLTSRMTLERFGKTQYVALSRSLRSATERGEYARIHYHETKELFEEFCLRWLVNRSLMRSLHGADDEFKQHFEEFVMRVKAYVTAFLQNVHAVPDTVANMLHYAFGMNLGTGGMLPNQVNVDKVLKRLEKTDGCKVLVSLLDELRKGGRFPHVNAAVNHSKHRGVILAGVNEHTKKQGIERYSVILESFTFFPEEKPYPQVEFFGFFAEEFDRCDDIVVRLGVELNAVLSAWKASSPPKGDAGTVQ